MERETIRRIIVEGQEFVADVPLVERQFTFEENGNSLMKYKTLKAGKTLLVGWQIRNIEFM